MHTIEMNDWGVRLTLSGFVSKSRMDDWVTASLEAWKTAPDSFRDNVAMRALEPIAPDTRDTMVWGQQLLQEAGMTRSTVVVAPKTTVLLFRRIPRDSGVYEWERYFDAEDPDQGAQALACLKEGIDPDA